MENSVEYKRITDTTISAADFAEKSTPEKEWALYSRVEAIGMTVAEMHNQMSKMCVGNFDTCQKDIKKLKRFRQISIGLAVFLSGGVCVLEIMGKISLGTIITLVIGWL